MQPTCVKQDTNTVLEVAVILAIGFMRLAAQKSSQISLARRENSLDISAPQSGHPNNAEKIDDR